MKRILMGILATMMLSVQFFVHCTPVSTEPDDGEGPALLQLSLEQPGRRSAEFSGAPIPATVQLDRDTLFTELTWHTGQGYPLYSDTILNSTARSFTVDLYWMDYPLYKDTSDDAYYDTVWVSMGGGLKKSNKVVVKVTNLPIVVDSAMFDSISFLGQDTVWRCSLPVAVKTSYPFTIFARDLDNKQPLIQVLGNMGTITQNGSNPLEMEYLTPKGDFIDTIDFVIFDQQRGQAFRTLVVEHISPNIPPSIDSVQVQSTMLTSASMVNGVYRVAFTSFDTLKFRVFAHDTLGSIKGYIWSAGKNSITADSNASYRATYVCSTDACSDTLTDSAVVIDQITIKVYDDRGDTVVKKIELSKGELNEPPEIDRLLFGEKERSFTDTIAEVGVTGGALYTAFIECSDPEKEELTVTWTGSPSSRFSGKTDSTVVYTAPAVMGSDTLRVRISDGEIVITRIIIITVNDIAPRFDSLQVGDETFYGTDTIFELEALPGDTLLCVGYGTDRDTGDVMSYAWSAQGDGTYSVKIENRARYILPDPLINDTIILTLQDGEAQVVRRVICSPANRSPVIDSILGDGQRLIGNALFVGDSAAPADTIIFDAFARDPEAGPLIWAWSGSDSALFSVPDSSSVEYICLDSVYTDTISVTVTDEKGAFAVKKVLLTVDSTTAP